MGVVTLWKTDSYGLTFKLIRQADGLYALQTENGINYVTAVNGGGQGVGSRALETNRTWVLGWEKFRLWATHDCAYAFQAQSGHWLGLRYANPPDYTNAVLTTNSTGIQEINKFRLHPADFDPLPGSHVGPPGGISGGGTPVPPL